MPQRQVYASISHPDVSVTPAMYNAAFSVLGMDAIYLSFDVRDLPGSIAAMRALGIRGYSVSRPHKEAVVTLLDDIDQTARAIGAVNVIVNDGRHLTGYNTDASGAVAAVERHTEIRGRRAAVIGAGGAARAIAFGFASRGARVEIYSRAQERARRAAKEVGLAFAGGLDECAEAVPGCDIVVNATPVGGVTCAERSLLPDGVLNSRQVVLEVVFSPRKTELAVQAARAGCTVVYGVEMLLEQGLAAFTLFTGREAPAEVMAAALRAAVP